MQRNPLPDYLRHVLALAVIVSHATPVTMGDNKSEPLMLVTGGRLTLGTLAVYGFFFLSGHLITQSWQRDPHIGRYATRRALRIMPALLVAVIFGTGLAALFGRYTHNPYPYDHNAPLWTLWFEALCYVFIALFRGRAWMVAALGVLLIALGYHGVAPVLLLVFCMGGMLPRLPDVSLPRLHVDYSYGLYVYAFPVQQALAASGVRNQGALIVLTILLVLPLCALSWHLIEQPALRLRPPTTPK